MWGSVSDTNDINMYKEKKSSKLCGIKESMNQKRAFTDMDLM